jgi:chromosome partitioning protein
MLLQATSGVPRSAHVIVLGNEKGGSGKSTTAMHIAVALLKAGQRVATIDLDSRQQTFTHYIENRRSNAQRSGMPLEVPEHFAVARAEGIRVDENEAAEFGGFAGAINAVEHTHDFVVVDTPGNDTYLMRLAHSMADTLVTPLNDSFLDFDVLGTVDPATFEVTGASHYAKMVRHARRQRRIVDGGLTDWIVVRNRLALLSSRNKKLVGEAIDRLGLRLGFRATEGFSERVVFREFFPLGLTALDTLDEATLGQKPNLSHLTAKQEVKRLIEQLKLPIDEKGRRRAAARAEWAASQERPFEHDELIFGEVARDQTSRDEVSRGTGAIAPGPQDATL